MIIDLLRMPECLRSNDFKTFEGLLKLLGTSIKSDIDDITDLKDYSKCASHMLPLLAQSIGCPYFSNTTVDTNRLIIKNWWHMMRYKGTIPTLQLATSLALLAYDTSKGNDPDLYSRSVEIISDSVTGELYVRVVYQQIDNSNQTISQKELDMEQQAWIEELVQYVKPAGYRITYVPSQFIKSFLEVDIKHDVRVIAYTYNVTAQSGVGLTTLSDRTIKFDSIYKTLLDNNLLDINGNAICPHIPEATGTTGSGGTPFGRYNNKSTICQGCEYKNECEAVAILGIGAQELSGAGTLSGIQSQEPSMVERAQNIECLYSSDYTWIVTSPKGSVPYGMVKSWKENPSSKPTYFYVYNTTMPGATVPKYQQDYYQGIKIGEIEELTYNNMDTYTIKIDYEHNQYPEYVKGVSGQKIQFNIEPRDFR